MELRPAGGRRRARRRGYPTPCPLAIRRDGLTSIQMSDTCCALCFSTCSRWTTSHRLLLLGALIPPTEPTDLLCCCQSSQTPFAGRDMEPRRTMQTGGSSLCRETKGLEMQK